MMRVTISTALIVHLAEHVFEAQLISDFFTLWLDKGHLNNQNPEPANPTQKFSCSSIKRTTLNDVYYNGNKLVFIRYLMQELGSKRHLDRLTIYKSRPNRAKGAVGRITDNFFFSPLKY
jgi:chitinase